MTTIANNTFPLSQATRSDLAIRESVSDRASITSLMVPILLMASLVTAAILLISDYDDNSPIFSIWLLMHCLIGGALFLLSLRATVLIDGRKDVEASSDIKASSIILLAFAWGTTPALLSYFQTASLHLVFTSILCGLTLSAAMSMHIMPRASRILVCLVAGGFMANTVMLPNVVSMMISLITLTYFSVLTICARWYSIRLERQLENAELMAIQAQELSDVIQTLGDSTETYFWETDTEGRLVKGTDNGPFKHDENEPAIGSILLDMFVASKDSDLLKSRFMRRSEIVALELERRANGQSDGNWWRLTGRPHFVDSVFKGYRGVATNISVLREREQQANFLLEHDHLTGLLNRASFYQVVANELDQIDVDGPSASVLIWADLDNFKWVNDTFGHQGGDKLLKMVAARLQEACPPNSVFCRFGGDEFAIMVKLAPETQVEDFAESLTEKMAAPYLMDETEIQCSASIGLRTIDGDSADPDVLMKEADLALYAAKSAGRATWREYSEAFKARVRGERELARDLKEAISQDALNLNFQPIVDANSRSAVGVEVLSRWVHPVRGNVAPDVYIPVAESNGLIVDLGHSVIRHAIKAAAKMPADLTVSINISPVQMHSTALLQVIGECLAEHNVSADRIELEITETVFLSDNDFVLSRLRALKGMGLRIALDDFGTGFSSLSYLQRFPFDKLKLDQAFVQNLESSEQSRAIVRATISMAKAIGLVVTAEGVETEFQAEFLRNHRCDYLQGFLFSRPQNDTDLPYMLQRIETEAGLSLIELSQNVVPLKSV